jgi:hypothetical protein
MTTTMKKAARFVAALALATTVAACGNNSNNNTPDMAMPGNDGGGGGGDMAMETCVMNPMTSVELLNACTTAQTGDPAKDAPYYPSLAPNGNLPPLP